MFMISNYYVNIYIFNETRICLITSFLLHNEQLENAENVLEYLQND